jgi:hypothetical protein
MEIGLCSCILRTQIVFSVIRQDVSVLKKLCSFSRKLDALTCKTRNLVRQDVLTALSTY